MQAGRSWKENRELVSAISHLLLFLLARVCGAAGSLMKSTLSEEVSSSQCPPAAAAAAAAAVGLGVASPSWPAQAHTAGCLSGADVASAATILRSNPSQVMLASRKQITGRLLACSPRGGRPVPQPGRPMMRAEPIRPIRRRLLTARVGKPPSRPQSQLGVSNWPQWPQPPLSG